MDIKRINTYNDPRFSQAALNQHGCYMVDGHPCELLIVSEDTAIITGGESAAYPELIEFFRFHAPHITRFMDAQGQMVQTYPPHELLTIPLSEIQPSQFYVDEEKLAAIATFTQTAKDVIIQVLPHKGRYISLDGHTRLFLAAQRGWTHIRAVVEESDKYVFTFAEEALRRGIRTPADLTLVTHEEYVEKWHRFCDDFFAKQK